MIRSMTAFARGDVTAEWGTAQWEVRTVNHRYLDVSPRIPEDLRPLEPAVRERIAGRLGRGKVDCSLRVALGPGQGAGLAIDEDLARRLAEASRQVDGLLHDPARVNSMDILRWPGVIQTDSLDLATVSDEILGLLDRVLDELVEGRAREGEKIAALIETRCGEMLTIVALVREHLPEILAAARERLTARLAEVLAQLDPERLEQEMVILAQKSDVAEELDRIETHVGEVRRVLASPEPVGRRLDFLMQELNRETNTLGSKSLSTHTTRASVDLKVLVEQMREQVQNVE